MVVNTTPPDSTASLDRRIGTACRLHGRLAQEVLAASEGPEELVVKVVPVGQHDEGRIRHGGLADDAPRVEGHREALAGALGVPGRPPMRRSPASPPGRCPDS